MAIENEIACVILCAGKGTRMQSDAMHKVCFPLAGKPAINRIIETLKGAGISRFVAVVGEKAEQVIRTIAAEHPEVSYVYQGEQKGTGHAAQVAAEALERLGFAGPVLIAMGDKYIEPVVIRQLVESYVRTSADLVFAVARKADAPSAGRIVLDPESGDVLASIEMRDMQRARILGRYAALAGRNKPVARKTLLKMGLEIISNPVKLAKALGATLAGMTEGAGSVPAKDLREALGANPGYFNVAGKLLDADQAEQAARHVNVSLYLGRSNAVYDALHRLRPDNAQREYYLTDIVTLLASARDPRGQALWKVRAHELADANDVLGFNDPQELLAIADHLHRKAASAATAEAEPVTKLGKDRLKPLAEWVRLFETFPPKFRATLRELYGPDDAFIAERRKAYLGVLKRFGQRYGRNADVIVARAPGRINLMGRHVDHRGGHVNVMAINREVLMVAARRADDVVRLTHVDPKRFPDAEFSIGGLIGSMVWDDWLTYVNSRQVQQMVHDHRGDWSNYVKASTVRLQQQYRDVRVVGMDVAVTGNIPMAAGLSSSSAVVVAAAEACVGLNRFDVTPRQFVDMCGEGEWFVGSRGGSADHAGIRMGRRGSVARLSFFPFTVEGLYQFPQGYSLLVANSHIKAAKSGGARDQFNQRVAGYEFGFLLLKDRFPKYAHLLSHLRDFTAERLGVTPSEIYRMLAQLPLVMSPEEVTRTLADGHAQAIERVMSSHAAPAGYEIRETIVYGLAECRRAAMAKELLEANRLDRFSLLMARSHDGDRVAVCRVEGGKTACSPYHYDCGDNALRTLVADLRSEDPDRVLAAQLWMQAGGYRCSTPQIDAMVDLAAGVPGVVGAQLSGAGLGGCVMVLAADAAVRAVQKTLTEGYYGPSGLEPAIEVCIPVQGSGLLVF
ncbi:MAG: NTP transferase domain-containing protein [Phycisphaerae bacterium]|nr:NTP transferase domain-containing protein [Phycisphaerae bacterium]